MAHEITIRADGTAEMFSLRQSPWHKLGRVLPEEITDDRVLESAGLNWQVVEEPIFIGDSVKVGDDTMTTHREVAGYKALRRSDTREPLSVVGADYRVFQNAEGVDLLRRIAKETHVVWETAGSLRGGRDVWFMGRLPDLAFSVRGDATNTYMLLTNGHGNYRSLQLMPTTVRVVCANTLRAALGNGGEANRRRNARRRKTDATALAQGYAIHHNGGLDRAVTEVVNAYAAMVSDRDATVAISEKMASVRFTRADSVAYWDAVMRWSQRIADAEAKARESGTKVGLGIATAAVTRERNAILGFADSPTNNQPGTGGSLYAAMQTVVEYADHGGGDEAFWSAQFGGRARIKEAAWTAAAELVTVS